MILQTGCLRPHRPSGCNSCVAAGAGTSTASSASVSDSNTISVSNTVSDVNTISVINITVSNNYTAIIDIITVISDVTTDMITIFSEKGCWSRIKSHFSRFCVKNHEISLKIGIP